MRSRHVLTRRSLLAGLGGAALTLPLLDGLPTWLNALGTAAAAESGVVPRRFVVMWTPNGTVPAQWRPSGTETAFTLSPILAPLASHQKELLILDGLDGLSSLHGPGDQHQRAIGHCLTGTELLAGSFAGSDGIKAGWAGGISVDQFVADYLGTQTRLRSLELGVSVLLNDVSGRISYRGAGHPLPPENDPRAAFERLFADAHESAAARAERLARRKSVLDASARRYQALLPRLGAEDRQKLDAHLTALRDIEQRLDVISGTACSVPSQPPRLPPTSLEATPEVGRLQMDLLVAALACDLTRVGSLMWLYTGTSRPYPWLGIQDGHHPLAHDGIPGAAEKLTRISHWYAEQFAYLLTRMKSVREGNGTLLDHTLVVWVTEHSFPETHSTDELPYVAAGRAGGAVRTGRYLRFSGRVPHNDFWCACLNVFGIHATTFGNPAYCRGPLAGLT